MKREMMWWNFENGIEVRKVQFNQSNYYFQVWKNLQFEGMMFPNSSEQYKQCLEELRQQDLSTILKYLNKY